MLSISNSRENGPNASLIQHLEDHLAGQVSIHILASCRSSPGVDRSHLSWVPVSPHHRGLLGLPSSGFLGGKGTRLTNLKESQVFWKQSFHFYPSSTLFRKPSFYGWDRTISLLSTLPSVRVSQPQLHRCSLLWGFKQNLVHLGEGIHLYRCFQIHPT